MANVQRAALIYVLTLLGFVYGYAVARFQVPPYAFLESRVQELEAFVAGDAIDRDTSVLEKLQSDAGLIPKRFIRRKPKGIAFEQESLVIPGLKDRRNLPLVYSDDHYAKGYRLIVGALDFEGSFWGAVLIGQGGEVLHTWKLSTENLPGNSEPDIRKVLYGTYIGNDGSIIFTMQEHAGGIVKIDACGNEVWNLPGSYHHAIGPDGRGAFWSFVGSQGTFDQNLVKVSVDSGEILQTIDMAEVREKNEHLYIWNLASPFMADWRTVTKDAHITHGNDIDPLTNELADSFPEFETGDLLISYATTNLLFVLDPDTLEVKWWRIGITDFQHDPDWEPDGRISVFNNKTRFLNNIETTSEIVSIDPESYNSEVVYGGGSPRFRSLFNGRHQLTDFGTRMITSSDQGWVFEVDAAGEIVFSFLNAYNEKESLFLSEALHLPVDYFEGKPWEACE